MRSPARVLAIVASVAFLIPICGFLTDPAQTTDADIIVTAAPTYEPLAALRGPGRNLERFPQGAQLLLLHAGKAEPLVEGFAATADANVGFDAKTVLFAGKKAAGDPWQIWELTLKDRTVRRAIETAADAVRPLYLPFGRMVFALRTTQGYQLESAELDGSGVVQLTYMQASALPEDVLADGRILFEASFPLGSRPDKRPTPELFLVYSDGSGVESYRCDHGAARWGGKQLASGDVVFTHGASLARFTSPLAHETPVAAPRAEYAGTIAETASGAWLLSARPAAGAYYTLKLWMPGTETLQAITAPSGKDLVEPVLVVPRMRPKRHPSALHDWNYANLLALDARLSRSGNLKAAPASVRLEVQDAQGHAVVTGTAPVELDGSFFVKTPADQPIRFALLDGKGAVLRQEQGWFWIRRGEQRICVGCHTGPERASENRVPAVLLRTTTPVDLSGINSTGATKSTAPGGNR